MKEHTENCCLSKLSTLTDSQYADVMECIKTETLRRWPKFYALCDELADTGAERAKEIGPA